MIHGKSGELSWTLAFSFNIQSSSGFVKPYAVSISSLETFQNHVAFPGLFEVSVLYAFTQCKLIFNTLGQVEEEKEIQDGSP